ncbi:hypothetical protein GFS31_36460 [Leptolyngbya sp. BL0902]|uniref:hypothetical protein n=1 Tax=Leptolyngbya sp. BL0902 TaxID=1115757 RepID=UPI0019376A2C|nr:hypothetical protein [Leptolyngbya sp. BL0902]QQE66941.1 hypothetical protein GFS31_36460 [Leptolyngbya sp. BL0902]
MARYTHLLTLSEPATIPNLGDSIVKTLEDCGLSMVYANKDYFVAKEKPGQVALAQLTTIEVMINQPTSMAQTARVNLVVKNEELPLQRNNHCQRVFEAVSRAIGAML